MDPDRALTLPSLFHARVECGFNCHSKCVQSVKAACHHSGPALAPLEGSIAESGPPRECRRLRCLERSVAS